MIVVMAPEVDCIALDGGTATRVHPIPPHRAKKAQEGPQRAQACLITSSTGKRPGRMVS